MKTVEQLIEWLGSDKLHTLYDEDGVQASEDCIYALSLGETCFSTHCHIWSTQTDEDLKEGDVKYQQAVKVIELFVSG